MRSSLVQCGYRVSDRRVLTRLGVVLASLGIVICGATGSAGARPRAAAGIPRHVETWGYDDGCDGRASTALARGWLTYAESACGPNTKKARNDCHSRGRTYCLVMQYLDTNWDYPRDQVPLSRKANTSWWLHQRAPHRTNQLFSDAFGGGYLFNQTHPGVQQLFRSYVKKHYNADDGLLMDWQSPSLSMELYYSTCGCTTTAEIRSDAALRRAHAAMSATLTHRNGRPFMQADVSLPPNPFIPQGFDLLRRRTGVIGLIAEGQPEENGSLDPFYSTLLDQIAYIDHRKSDYVVMLSHGVPGASYQQRSRRVQEATDLLGYSRGHLVDWADLEEGSADIAVWPEEGIYPTRPVESMGVPRGRGCLRGTGQLCTRGGHKSVQVARGVYRREFRMCYDQSVPFGPCAAIVNTTGRRVTVKSRWLRYAYHRQIVFHGGDVQSGGSLRPAPFTGGSTKVGAHDAVLLAS